MRHHTTLVENEAPEGHTLVLWGGMWDTEYHRREGVPSSEVVTVFLGLWECGLKRRLEFFRVKVDGRSYTKAEFEEFVHAVNEFSTYHGGTQIY